MRTSKFQCAVVHFVNAIILINLLGSAFLPTYLMAQTTDGDDEERILHIPAYPDTSTGLIRTPVFLAFL